MGSTGRSLVGLPERSKMKSQNSIATALTIAGSDPTGGAGIQTDLKTMTKLGVYAAAAITCITVQNSHGVSRIEPLAPDLVREQVQAVLADHRVTHIKIGMVGSPALARCLGELLRDFTGQVIYDPVLAASTGQELARQDTLDAVMHHLLGQVTALTPNLPELADMAAAMGAQEAGQLTDRTAIEQAAQILLDRYPNLECVLVKGGHGQGALLTDYCFHSSGKSQHMEHASIKTQNSHGTGCTTASALTALHMQTGNYEQAFVQTIAFVQTLLEKSAGADIIRNPDGRGPLLHTMFNEQ